MFNHQIANNAGVISCFVVISVFVLSVKIGAFNSIALI